MGSTSRSKSEGKFRQDSEIDGQSAGLLQMDPSGMEAKGTSFDERWNTSADSQLGSSAATSEGILRSRAEPKKLISPVGEVSGDRRFMDGRKSAESLRAAGIVAVDVGRAGHGDRQPLAAESAEGASGGWLANLFGGWGAASSAGTGTLEADASGSNHGQPPRARRHNSKDSTGSKDSYRSDESDWEADMGYQWMQGHDNLLRAQNGKVQKIVKTMHPGDHAGELSLLF